jgi:hypothetical protein
MRKPLEMAATRQRHACAMCLHLHALLTFNQDVESDNVNGSAGRIVGVEDNDQGNLKAMILFKPARSPTCCPSCCPTRRPN